MWAGSCSGGDGRQALPDASAKSSGRVLISITGARQGDAGVAAEARLMRYRDLDGESAEILTGMASQVAEGRLAPGRCIEVDREALLDEALGRASPDAAVQLMDAGDLVVRAAGRTVPVAPRYVPEIVPSLVSGVVYAVDSTLLDDVVATPLAGDEVYLSAFGGEDVGRFDVTLPMPAAPRLLSVGGQDLAGGVDGLAVERTTDLEIKWALDGVRAGDEGVTVVLAWGDAGRGEIRCRASEAGRLLVPRALMTTIPEDTAFSLSVERSAHTPFSAPGLDGGGEIEISVRDVVSVR